MGKQVTREMICDAIKENRRLYVEYKDSVGHINQSFIKSINANGLVDLNDGSGFMKAENLSLADIFIPIEGEYVFIKDGEFCIPTMCISVQDGFIYVRGRSGAGEKSLKFTEIKPYNPHYINDLWNYIPNNISEADRVWAMEDEYLYQIHALCDGMLKDSSLSENVRSCFIEINRFYYKLRTHREDK